MPGARRLRAVLFNTTSRNGHHGCALVCAQIGALAEEAGIDIVSHVGLAIPREFASRRGYDLILVNGEGTVHDNQPGARQIAVIGRFARKAGKPAYLINAQYERNGADIAEGISAFRQRFVRDSVSRAEMEAAGLTAAVVPDLSLTWDRAPVGSTGDGLVVIDSVSNAASAELYDFAAANNGLYLTIKTEPPALPDFADRNRVRRTKYFLRRAFARALPAGWRREKMRPTCTGFDEFVAALGNGTGLIVSGRFHGVCMALVLEIPVLGLRSNTSKVEGLMNDIGLSGRSVDNVPEAQAKLVRSATNSFSYSPDDLSRIRTFRAKALEAARRMFAAIASDAADGTGQHAATARP
jgi:hypothetical protein